MTVSRIHVQIVGHRSWFRGPSAHLHSAKHHHSLTARQRIGFAVLALCTLVAAMFVTWGILSAVLGWSMVSFSTDALGPVLPKGALALERPTLARDLVVGDVVTIEREGFPVSLTGEVASIELSSTSPGARVLGLRATSDTSGELRYLTVTEVHTVIRFVPVLGAILVIATKPIVLATLTAAAVVVGMRALWPEQAVPTRGRMCR